MKPNLWEGWQELDVMEAHRDRSQRTKTHDERQQQCSISCVLNEQD
jgi:hypothetical protein